MPKAGHAVAAAFQNRCIDCLDFPAGFVGSDSGLEGPVKSGRSIHLLLPACLVNISAILKVVLSFKVEQPSLAGTLCWLMSTTCVLDRPW